MKRLLPADLSLQQLERLQPPRVPVDTLNTRFCQMLNERRASSAPPPRSWNTEVKNKMEERRSCHRGSGWLACCRACGTP